MSDNLPTLHIVRGLPGSGRSTLAKHLTEAEFLPPVYAPQQRIDAIREAMAGLKTLSGVDEQILFAWLLNAENFTYYRDLTIADALASPSHDTTALAEADVNAALSRRGREEVRIRRRRRRAPLLKRNSPVQKV